MTKQLGILGYPLAHSISPAFQQAALDHLGIDARYDSWPTAPQDLPDRVEQLRSDEVMGANVTIPHKESIIPLLDELDEVASAIGGVNTIVNQGGRLKGFNTDAPGFMRGLCEDGAFETRGTRVVVIGAGGAARAVAYSLAAAGVSFLVIVNRTPERARSLARYLLTVFKDLSLEASGRLEQITRFDLLVNCTSIGTRHSETEGMLPIADDLIRAGALVYDLVYNPSETRLIEAARERGARTVGGLPMLVYQGAEAFRLWTGVDAPVQVMFEAAKEALA